MGSFSQSRLACVLPFLAQETRGTPWRVSLIKSALWSAAPEWSSKTRPSARSKFMDATGVLNAGDPMPEEVLSSLDYPQRLGVSGIYELPVG